MVDKRHPALPCISTSLNYKIRFIKEIMHQQYRELLYFLPCLLVAYKGIILGEVLQPNLSV
jgi:hypothetical protein